MWVPPGFMTSISDHLRSTSSRSSATVTCNSRRTSSCGGEQGFTRNPTTNGANKLFGLSESVSAWLRPPQNEQILFGFLARPLEGSKALVGM